MSDPFVWLERGRPVAHVGVLRHALRLDGEDRVVAGLHAVASHPDHRGRGFARACLEAALSAVDRDHDAVKLHTDYPGLYAKLGFRVAATERFRWTLPAAKGAKSPRLREDAGSGPGARSSGRRLAPSASPEDAARLLRALRRPALASGLESRDGGWLVGIDACLNRLLDRAFVEVPGGLLAGTVQEGRRLRVDLLVDEGGLDLERALDAFPEPFDEVIFTFDPGPFAPGAVAEPTPIEEGVLMVRGRWPEHPVAVSSLWAH